MGAGGKHQFLVSFSYENSPEVVLESHSVLVTDSAMCAGWPGQLLCWLVLGTIS